VKMPSARVSTTSQHDSPKRCSGPA
jgi:hypothetical protein